MSLRTIDNSRLKDGEKLDNISVTQPVDLDALEARPDASAHIADLANPHATTKSQVGL